MRTIRYDPFLALSQLQREFGRLFGHDLPAPKDDRTFGEADWNPATDIRETDDGYLLSADLPGVRG